jgi:hypothetical protein
LAAAADICNDNNESDTECEDEDDNNVLSYTFKQPEYQIDLTTPLCIIGTVGKPGFHFPTRLFFSKELITDEGFEGLPKAGDYGYLLRGSGDLYLHYTYAKLQRTDDSGTF